MNLRRLVYFLAVAEERQRPVGVTHIEGEMLVGEAL